MSQEKVDRYKKAKANRKKELKRQKRNTWLTRIGIAVFLVAITVFMGWSVWHTFIKDDSEPEQQTITLSQEKLTTTANALLKETTAAGETTSASDSDETEESTTEEPTTPADAAEEPTAE